MKKEKYKEPNISVYLFEHEDVSTLYASEAGSDDIRPFSTLQTINLEGDGS